MLCCDVLLVALLRLRRASAAVFSLVQGLREVALPLRVQA